ncbi:B-cell receptor-associated 31-like protein [Lichtheimia hyalospora FSU 10163]|nr:B-cell receptor-associated 31-like protein [Lichtheimia hyalospora FSU 10163]
MAIQYALTFAILVTEATLFCVLVLPFPPKWRKTMLRLVSTSPALDKAMYSLKVTFGFIFLLFVDAINRLYSIEERHPEGEDMHDYTFEVTVKANKFYAQRNLYLTGFTLFLSFILQRTSSLIFQVVQREEELERVQTETHTTTRKQQEIIDKEAGYKKEMDALSTELKDLKQQQRDYETLKLQVAQQDAEYQRLADERNALEQQDGAKVETRKDI